MCPDSCVITTPFGRRGKEKGIMKNINTNKIIFITAVAILTSLLIFTTACKTAGGLGRNRVEPADEVISNTASGGQVKVIRMQLEQGTNRDRDGIYSTDYKNGAQIYALNIVRNPEWDCANGKFVFGMWAGDENKYSNVNMIIRLYKVADEYGAALETPILIGEKEHWVDCCKIGVQLRIQCGGDPMPSFIRLTSCEDWFPKHQECNNINGDMSECPYEFAFCLIHGEDRYGYYELNVEYNFPDGNIIKLIGGGFSFRHKENIILSSEEWEMVCDHNNSHCDGRLEDALWNGEIPPEFGWESMMWRYTNLYGGEYK